MSELIKINEIQNVPAAITFDFESVKKALTEQLEKYKGIVLTAETCKEGKDLIKEINATRKQLNRTRIDEAKKAAEPIKAFESQMKELTADCDALMASIREQTDRFDEEQKEVLRQLLNDSLRDLYAHNLIREEFKTAGIDHLVLLGNLTEKGKLTKKAKDGIEEIANDALMLQQRTDLRLSRLEAECYKAGMGAPLTRQHVNHFLFDEDDSYSEKLAALMESEKRREIQAAEYRKAQENRQAQANKQADAEIERLNEKEHHRNIEQQATEPAQETPKPEKGQAVVTCTFTLELADSVPNEAVEKKLADKLKQAGFTTLTNIEINRAGE